MESSRVQQSHGHQHNDVVQSTLNGFVQDIDDMRRIKCLRRRSSIIHILLVAGCLCDQYVAAAFLCQSLPENTLDALSFAIEASPELLVLCPFEIKGGGCGTTNARTSQSETIGHVVAQGSSQTIVCDLAQLGGKYPDDFDFTGVSKSGQQNRTTSPSHGRGCVIDCPGTHFSVEANASLTVDGFTFRSSKSSAITVASRGQLHVFASAFERFVLARHFSVACLECTQPFLIGFLDVTTA